MGPPAGGGEGEEEQTAGLAAGAGAVGAPGVGLSSLGSGSLCLLGSTCEGKVSSRAASPGSWSSEEDVWAS